MSSLQFYLTGPGIYTQIKWVLRSKFNGVSEFNAHTTNSTGKLENIDENSEVYNANCF